eukprot:gene14456-biopygen11561
MTFTTATWNVRTLYAAGKREQLQLEMERYRLNVLGISEMRWKGMGETILDNVDRIWWSGEENKRASGVGFLVNKETAPSIMECKPISNRIIVIRVRAKPKNIAIVQLYAPTSSSSEDDIKSFYEKLEETLKALNKRDHMIVQGDWNCQIGRDAKRTWPGSAGKFGLGATNERGEMA